jgi:hypothetical protein
VLFPITLGWGPNQALPPVPVGPGACLGKDATTATTEVWLSAKRAHTDYPNQVLFVFMIDMHVIHVKHFI